MFTLMGSHGQRVWTVELHSWLASFCPPVTRGRQGVGRGSRHGWFTLTDLKLSQQPMEAEACRTSHAKLKCVISAPLTLPNKKFLTAFPNTLPFCLWLAKQIVPAWCNYTLHNKVIMVINLFYVFENNLTNTLGCIRHRPVPQQPHIQQHFWN